MAYPNNLKMLIYVNDDIVIDTFHGYDAYFYRRSQDSDIDKMTVRFYNSNSLNNNQMECTIAIGYADGRLDDKILITEPVGSGHEATCTIENMSNVLVVMACFSDRRGCSDIHSDTFYRYSKQEQDTTPIYLCAVDNM
jgi:hypothetical protein